MSPWAVLLLPAGRSAVAGRRNTGSAVALATMTCMLLLGLPRTLAATRRGGAVRHHAGFLMIARARAAYYGMLQRETFARSVLSDSAYPAACGRLPTRRYRPPWMESLPYRTQLSPPPFVTRSHHDAAVRGY
eukprot:COSAG06_NODE_22887_length_709_cov_7.695082_2_plen_131_part_01